ncbi:YtxH domain-containing protein [Ohtaekwangia koreensis]|uniref:Gas vesicle protein n=1 Tax=Ohtaekwangia koreensis TaxID=688867 RepID=A0A1T5LBM8_9BACT|nr:YtxH domain-containing protein [Ohtaekwangia koreensis]SKC73446.1 Gas vesicle protein [Ohtaekwangia koreensis]
MNRNSKIILGIVGAAAAGAVIGLLLAPDKGSDLRKRISKAADEFAGSLTDAILSNREKLLSAKDQFVNEAKGLKSEAASRFGRVKESVS